MVERHSRVNVRKSHPGLYHSLMTFSLTSVALAANFWTTHPAFSPYGINKIIIGLIFFALGISQLVFLNVFRDLRGVRIVLAASIAFMFFWGASNTQQFFTGNASLQLPILYLTLSILQVPLLIEPPVNPMTKRPG